MTEHGSVWQTSSRETKVCNALKQLAIGYAAGPRVARARGWPPPLSHPLERICPLTHPARQTVPTAHPARQAAPRVRIHCIARIDTHMPGQALGLPISRLRCTIASLHAPGPACIALQFGQIALQCRAICAMLHCSIACNAAMHHCMQCHRAMQRRARKRPFAVDFGRPGFNTRRCRAARSFPRSKPYPLIHKARSGNQLGKVSPSLLKCHLLFFSLPSD
jgi:hypothetical protein